jgi:hypothetical protein
MLLFESEWLLERTVREEKALTFHDVQPRTTAGKVASSGAAETR